MILFPAIWWLFPAVALGFIALSFSLTRSGKLENAAVRKALVGAGAMLGFLTLALPVFEQPAFHSPFVQYGLGLPLLVLGLLGRIYPMLYLRQKDTTTALDAVGKLVDTGPYAWVRHPQYTAGLVMVLGWFLLWGAWYALCVLPFIAGIIYAQARVEEMYILGKMFGKTYGAYRERVGMLLPRLSEKHALRITVAFLGLYAGLLAVQHGVFEMLQGNRAPEGLLINAIGPPCQTETVWHACFPAMTLLPNLLVTGIAATLVGLAMMIWATACIERRRGGLVLALLSLLALPVGGGFVPVWIGLIAATAARGLHTPVKPGGAVWRTLAALWPWPLALLAIWMPGSWLLGHFFGPAMLATGGALFIVFDVGMPVLATFSGLASKFTRSS
jgi:protein-S-isoprenylcysteine O-methyltransferase Ste14